MEFGKREIVGKLYSILPGQIRFSFQVKYGYWAREKQGRMKKYFQLYMVQIDISQVSKYEILCLFYSCNEIVLLIP